MLTRDRLAARTIGYQLAGYGVLLFLILGDELLDFPHVIFGFPATPVNGAEVMIEASYILALGCLSTAMTWRFTRRIRFLEGCLPICSFCKRIREGQEWKSLEGYLSDRSEALFSHGLCPECLELHYGEYAERGGGAAPGTPAAGR